MSDTRAVVDEFYRRLAEGALESLPELFAEEIDWDIYGSEEVPWVGRRSTREEVKEFFTTLPRHLQMQTFSIERVLVDGEDAVVFAHMRQIVQATGKPFESPCAFRFTVVDGKISRYLTYEDSLALARAFTHR
ncbi:nuclear transport factor 2 family protein [Streptomyces sp. MST-110588]|uniref:nuclear transport factor 2 family protein n=1 Tax=Streptomyces sp. MST-110588 TaxID=2833628 RepID=UPI001F5DB17C|nr:nuclear transport factor 2 family protein [Streptomyces sp. MST-110588]UNO42209.1 nuclear transport factor 2 family protein [Streptomyces sp. MST-110588]